jgi:hypothetical protein
VDTVEIPVYKLEVVEDSEDLWIQARKSEALALSGLSLDSGDHSIQEYKSKVAELWM